MTSNEKYLEEFIGRLVDIRRLTDGESRRLRAFIEDLDKKDLWWFRQNYEQFRLKRITLSKLIKEFRERRRESSSRVETEILTHVDGLAQVQSGFLLTLLALVLPFYKEELVDPGNLKNRFRKQQSAGRLPTEWTKSMLTRDSFDALSSIRRSAAEGHTVELAAAMMQRQVFPRNQRAARSILETLSTSAVNIAGQAVSDANPKAFGALVWESVLDKGTTAICQSRDGKAAPLGNHPLPDWAEPLDPPLARPPAHPGCRSVMRQWIDGEHLLGDRQVIVGEADFVQIARQTGQTVAKVRSDWITQNIGRVPNKTTFQQWLKRRDAAYQDQILGPARGKLFREGNLTLDDFVDKSGRELTLKELAATKPGAFVAAGLDPTRY